MTEAEQRLYTLANAAALVLFNQHGNPPTLALSQKVLAEQGASLLAAYKETIVLPEVSRLRAALQEIADGQGGSAFAARALQPKNQ